MGHQLRFFLTPTDLQLLEQRLRAQCPVAILDSRSEQSAPTMLSTLAVAESGKTWLKIFLVPPDLVDTLTFERVAQQGYWTVDLLRAPAVELSRCFYDGKILRVGRLFFHRGFYDEAGTWVEKPATTQVLLQALAGLRNRVAASV